jgi:hypothetical protein
VIAGESTMNRMVLLLGVLIATLAAPTALRAQTRPAETDSPFRFELEEAPPTHRGRGVEGYVYNGSPWRITNVRLRVETIDSSGAVTGETSGWVVGDVRAGGRGYFFVPVSAPATSYRATVQSFDKVGLEVQRPEAP